MSLGQILWIIALVLVIISITVGIPSWAPLLAIAIAGTLSSQGK